MLEIKMLLGIMFDVDGSASDKFGRNPILDLELRYQFWVVFIKERKANE